MSRGKTKTMTLADLILVILDQNSGGVKETKLITEIVARSCEFAPGVLVKEFEELQSDQPDGDHWTRRFLDMLDRKLKEMETSGKIGLLNYAWPMGDVERRKTFVYLPSDKNEEQASDKTNE